MKRWWLSAALVGVIALSGNSAAQEKDQTPSQKTSEALDKLKGAPGAVGKTVEELKEWAKAKLQEMLGGKPQASKQDAIIREVLELTGAKKQIQQIPDMVSSQLGQRQKEMDPTVYDGVKQITADSYKADALYETVAAKFKENFDQPRLSTVLEFARTPLAKKMTQLELQAATPQGIQELQKFAAQLKDNPPAKQRLSLVQRLDDAVAASALSVKLTLATAEGLIKAIDRTLPPEKRLKAGQLEQVLKDMSAQLEGPLKNQTLTSFLYAYRTVSDDELKQYIQFAESDAGKWFIKVLSDGYLVAMSSAAEKAGNQMAKAMPPGGRPGAPDALVLPERKSAEPGTARYSPAGKRDPFLPLAQRTKASRRPRENLSPLERYELGQLKLVAVVWDIKEPKAMVEDAAGLGYVVKVGTPIGSNEGKIKTIKPTEVVVEEIAIDFYGARKPRQVSMRLQPK